MGELFVLDWSFVLVLIMLAVLITALAVRSRRLKRRQKLEERRAAKRAFNEWMASSSQPLADDQHDATPGR